MSQTLKPGHLRLVWPEANDELLVDGFLKATSAPLMPPRQ
jgi:hypothetical protein